MIKTIYILIVLTEGYAGYVAPTISEFDSLNKCNATMEAIQTTNFVREWDNDLYLNKNGNGMICKKVEYVE